MTAKPLKPQWLLFINNFVDCRDYTEAALRAGYSKNGVQNQVARLMKNDAVRLELDRRCAEANQIVSLRTDITLNRVLNELAKIAFYDPRKAVKWGSHVIEKDRKAIVVNDLDIVSSDEIDPDTAAAIASISRGKDGQITVRFHDKRQALVDIGRHLGLRNGTLDVNVTIPEKLDRSQLAGLSRAKLLQLEQLCEAIEEEAAADRAKDVTAEVTEVEDDDEEISR